MTHGTYAYLKTILFYKLDVLSILPEIYNPNAYANGLIFSPTRTIIILIIMIIHIGQGLRRLSYYPLYPNLYVVIYKGL